MPTGPWSPKQTKPDENSHGGFPGLRDHENVAVTAKSQYEETQENELVALEAIYGDDFQTIETQSGAWKVCFESQSVFKIWLID